MLIKDGYRVWLIKAPKDALDLLGLPKGATVVKTPKPPVDVVLFFAKDQAELEAHLSKAREAVDPKGSVWVAYHKGTSKVKTDIHRDTIHPYGATVGLEGVSLISINDDWSAMRFKVK